MRHPGLMSNVGLTRARHRGEMTAASVQPWRRRLIGPRAAFAVGLALAATGGSAMAFTLTSPAFPPNGEIPGKYTCEGDDVSPPLAWSGVPPGTKSFALIVDDPDAPDPAAPRMTWVHWVLFNLPATVSALPEAIRLEALPSGTAEGLNDWKRTGYGGPCPPIGRHRYFFKLHALDTELSGLRTPTKADLERAMEGHIRGKADLIGTYQKKKAR
jgi:Raf kinase inhibitor-like YbhB/YbcL family protein